MVNPTDTNATIEELFREVFSVGSVQRLYAERLAVNLEMRDPRGSGISTVALRVVGGDGKGTQCLRI
jgi:hypothetical protein